MTPFEPKTEAFTKFRLSGLWLSNVINDCCMKFVVAIDVDVVIYKYIC